MTDLTKPQPLDTIRAWQDADRAPALQSATTAAMVLASFGDAAAFFQSAEINLRMGLGNLLLTIQRQGLYEKLGHTTWTDFLENGLSSYKLSTRLAQQAIELAKTKTLQKLEPSERGMISVSNGHLLAKVERANGSVKPEIVEKAKTMSRNELATEVGTTTGTYVRAWVSDREAAPYIARILEFAKRLSADAAQAFADLLEGDEIKLLAGDGADNEADCIIAELTHAIQNEISDARAREKTLE